MARTAIASRPRSGPYLSPLPYRSLRGHGGFAEVYRRGRRRRCGSVTVLTANGDSGLPTVGVVAGKRVGSAVARNRAKRRMRAAVSLVALKPDTVYVLVADIGVLSADFATLLRWISDCVQDEVVKEER